MKCKKIALLGCGAIFFVAAAQLISCGGQTTDYTVSISSPNLVLDKNTVKKGTDLDVKISVKQGVDDTLLVPHSLDELSIGGQKVETDKYTYSLNDDGTAKLAIPANVLTGDVAITAEPDKTMKRVGEYAHVYVKDKSVSFEIENVPGGEYFVYGLTDSQQTLNNYTYTDGGQEKTPTGVTINIEHTGPVKIKFTHQDNIDSYVTATMLKVIANDNVSLSPRFNLLDEYNGKGVAFKYKLPISCPDNNFSVVPIIATGARYLAESPTKLQTILPKPRILNIANPAQGVKSTYLDKKGTANPYYLANSGADVSTTGVNLFIGYFKDIPTNGANLEISSLIKNSDKYKITSLTDHKVFIKTDVHTNSRIFAYNENALLLNSVYDADSFESLDLSADKRTFYSYASSNVYIAYEMSNNQILSNYGVGIFKNDVETKDTGAGVINIDSSYSQKSYVFGNKETNKPIISNEDLGNVRNYSYIMKIETKSSEPIVDSSDIYAYGSEIIKAEGTKTFIPMKFGLIASDYDESGNYTYWYAPSSARSIPAHTNYLVAANHVDKVTLDYIAITFKQFVDNDVKITFTSESPTSVTFNGKDADHVKIDNNGSLGYLNCFKGVPYSCRLAPTDDDLYRNLNKENVKLTVGGEEVTDFSFKNNVLHYTPKNNSGLSINATAIEKHAYFIFGDDSVAHKAPVPQNCGFDNGVTQVDYSCIKDSEVIIAPKTDYVFDDSKTLNPNDFKCRYYHMMTPVERTPNKAELISENGNAKLKTKIKLTFPKLDKSDDNQWFVFYNSNNVLDSYWKK